MPKKFKRKILALLLANNSGGDSRQSLLDGMPFYAPLTHTGIPSRSSGLTGAFTRATVDTTQNNDGFMVSLLSGEMGFPGARRVRNNLQNSADLTTITGGWVKNVALNEPVGGVSDPNGGTTAYTLTQGIAGSAQWYRNPASAAGHTWLNHIYIRRRTGTGNVYIITPAGVAGTALAITTDWQRLKESPVLVAGTTPYFGVQLSANGDAVDVWHPQEEDVTGRTDQTTPSEYVSVGVESAPYYHGSFVDGVKCFPTDISGNPIPSTVMKTYKPETLGTTKTRMSRMFNDAVWTIATASTTQNALGADGDAATGWTLTDNSAVVSQERGQAGTLLTAANYTDSYLIKKTTGAQASYPIIYANAVGGLIALATIDTSNGVATAWTAYTALTVITSSAICTSYNSGYWLVELTFLASAAIYNQIIVPAGTTNATQSTGIVDVAAQGSCVVFDSQRELGNKSTARILNTSAVADATRNAAFLTYSGGQVANFKTIGSRGFLRETGVSSVGIVVALDDGTANNYVDLYLADATNALFGGGVGGVAQWSTSASNAYTPATKSNMFQSFAVNSILMAKDGTGQTPDVVATNPIVTQLDVGHAVGVNQLNGHTGGIYADTKVFSQSQDNVASA